MQGPAAPADSTMAWLSPSASPPRHKRVRFTDHKQQLSLPEHSYSSAQRRGPMEEMRQLLRILVKIIPAAEAALDDALQRDSTDTQFPRKTMSSINTIRERYVHIFLRALLGASDAPYPEWGLRTGTRHEGWAGYLAGEDRITFCGPYVLACCDRDEH